MKPYLSPTSGVETLPPIYLMEGLVVALVSPNPQLTKGLPFCEVVDGMPQWIIGSLDYQGIYRELKVSLASLGLTYSDLEGRLLYRTQPPQTRRRLMRKLSGLIVNRMAGLAAEVAKADAPNDRALKLYQMMPVDHRGVLENHLKEGPCLAQGYELYEHRDELIQIGLLTRVVVGGKTGSVAANMVGAHVYNAGLGSHGESRKDKI
jgi:hypothetical protein